MPSVRYYNQTAPFWDFVANMEEQGSNHPFFANRRGEGEQDQEGESSWGWGPWGQGGPWGHRQRGGFPFRGPPPTQNNNQNNEFAANDATPNEKEVEAGASGAAKTPQEGNPGESAHAPSPEQHWHQRNPHGCHGRRGRGFGGRGGWGGRGGHPGMFGMHPFFSSFFNQGNNEETTAESTDFNPDADVFDTENSFVIHVALAGAKKEDVGVNWDAEKSELSVAGVIYRPGDEEFLKDLAMNERKVGPFEKKIRLGSRAHPAQVDADMITAKLEDGVLTIQVPKLDKDYVEIKKVDIA